MIKILVMIGISIFLPWFWFITVPYAIYLFLTIKPRREKYVRQALIWETGGLLGTGDVDLEKAVKLYTKACNLGDCEGCFNLAEMYRNGKGVERNVLKANELLLKAEELDPYKYAELQQEIDEAKKEADKYVSKIMKNIKNIKS